ncbi:MAG: hypothetical protein Q7S56_01455 [Nanoarchaeota archaeon]|nr:hypothetical protein [Nanoarchaeota archaeon]
MGIDLHTALVIQGNEVYVDTTSKGGNDKPPYGFMIYRFERDNYRPILSSDLIFSEKTRAKEEGEKLVETIKKLDLSKEISKIERILGDDKQAVEEVVKLSQEGFSE